MSKRNENKNIFDTNPIELKPGLQVLLQGVKCKLWNIEGEIVEVRPSGRSAIIYVPEKQSSYLRNRRFMKLNPIYEYKDSKDTYTSLLITMSQSDEKSPDSILQSWLYTSKPKRERKQVSFSDWTHIE